MSGPLSGAPGRRADLADPRTAREVARRAGLVLKHRLGQNLLVDSTVVSEIVDALDPGPDDDVLEVGPGIGTLTTALAARAGRVVAVELDPACVRASRQTLATHPNAEVVHLDALRADPRALGLGERWLLAGNIPYTITGALLTHVLEEVRPPVRAVLMVQREVAARLAAGPGDWSLATVAVRSLATVERLRDVPPHAFEPAPAVHSSVIRLVPRAAIPEAERGAVLRLARACFQRRRKMLRNGLAGALGGDQARALQVLEAAGVDPERRPGTLDLEEWRALARAAA